jgi:glycosyltransferase involved in cell wall biosynthesis
MKLVITVEEFDPKKGYLEYHLAKELTRKGHDVCIFTFGSGNRSFSQKIDGFKVINLSYSLTLHGYHFPRLVSIANIVGFIKKEKPHIIHCVPLDSPLSLIFILLSDIFHFKIAGPIVTQLNGFFLPWNTEQKLLFSLSRIIVTNYASKKSAKIFAKSNWLMEIVAKSYNLATKKFTVIPLGTDPNLYKFSQSSRYELRKEMNLNDEEIVILYSGKIDPSKGIDLLINAISPIMIENKLVKLLIIGRGPPSYSNYINNLSRDLGISNRVIFQPWADKKKLAALYSVADIAVWPGLSSISIVDAASVGLPLIIAKAPAEIFAISDNNGLSFEIGNIQELRKHLVLLIGNPALRKKMGQRSRFLVEKNLNWASISSEYLCAYKKILKEENNRS